MTDIPAEMTAIEITTPGGPEVLQPITRGVPEPKPGEVLIRVAAAGVNRPDLIQRIGAYPPPAGASDLPGLEVAGEVVAVHESVQKLEVGETVCALVHGGGYAEYCVAPEVQCLRVPNGFSMVEAAALPETYFTVWSNVFERGRLTTGERFLVHGGSSGIGTTAIQLASQLGMVVYATAGTDEKCAACVELGAKACFNYKTTKWWDELRRETEAGGVDVILDMVGGDYIQHNLDALRADGRLVMIAFLGGSKSEIDFMRLMQQRLTVTGSTLRPQSVAAKGAIAKALRERVWPLLDSGTIRPIIHATFPLEQASEAHALMESSAHIGKIILETGD